MQRTTILFVVLAAVFAAVQLATSQQAPVAPQPPAQAEADSILRVGETVGLNDAGDRYSIVVNPMYGRSRMFDVIEVHDNYVVLTDKSKKTQLRIPLWSIKSVEVSATGIRS